ncbi:SDR family oxidoreductase [Galbibacter pacificus]|uniref:SDR family oxidoreductase n=1 Tax=Galbibacter pacificus TaxID=2996052 RepID=A0ABT6FMS3_9FLAO|nr:SDR family oxidoreductase [Galbibacter pacificus]MDG3581080.1 SDR family oxidoreductase [Galbibacter pacificus]MDG3584558.1 SDR family oxidoreductase [Galbibacter pacificus]
MVTKKVWFITGASKGMGLEITKAILNNGDKVIATSRNPKNMLEKLDGNLIDLLALDLDVTNEQDVKEAINIGCHHFGRIDVVVNNAGYNLLGNIEELSNAEFRKTMDVNLFGMANVIRHVLPYLRNQKSGHIINTSSMMGYIGHAGNGSYNASKFAVIGMSEALAQELAPFGINVTILAPGTFRTSFMSEDSLSIAKNAIEGYNLEKQVEIFRSYDGMQLGDPKKLAQVLLKISEMSSPPIHLPLGSDSFNAIKESREREREELEKWKQLSLQTDFK